MNNRIINEENTLSRERMLVLLKHHKALEKELKKLYPEENEEMLERYRNLEVAFNEVINFEVKYQAMRTGMKQ